MSSPRKKLTMRREVSKSCGEYLDASLTEVDASCVKLQNRYTTSVSMTREMRKSPSTVPTRLATAAGLRVDETRPRFARWKAFSRGDEADHIRFSEGTATNHPDK
jgi:hypothetical protein